jgi:hypothetical protein
MNFASEKKKLKRNQVVSCCSFLFGPERNKRVRGHGRCVTLAFYDLPFDSALLYSSASDVRLKKLKISVHTFHFRIVKEKEKEKEIVGDLEEMKLFKSFFLSCPLGRETIAITTSPVV